MNAIFAHGGKQYRVMPGDVLRLERVAGDKGASVEFSDVRLVSDNGEVKAGKSAAGAKVVATIVGQDRGPKVIIFKKKRCKQYRRTKGHRQAFTEVRIERIG